MNKKILTTSVAIVMTAAGTAAAADLPRGPAPYYPPPASVYNWTGFYAGLNLGYEWGTVTNSGIDPSGVAGGGQVGYNWQIGQFVFGAETDIQASSADDTFAPYKFSNPWFGTLRGRAGFAINNVLLYGTLGLAYGDLKAQFGGLDESKTSRWLGRRPRYGSGLYAELVGKGRVPLYGSRQPFLHDHRRRQWASGKLSALWCELSLLTLTHARMKNSGPRRPEFYFESPVHQEFLA